MIAADAHYGQDRPEDHDYCASCNRPFRQPDLLGFIARQDDTDFSLCDVCAYAQDDEE
ncbi:hypothetical protein [Paracoccus alcaliphilus]|nr:hypothetical protein [Paracoccus alcaliphilus]WCR17539.1 hypothetical protein JHW40_14555 [Paracoccus alcaliphilus]